MPKAATGNFTLRVLADKLTGERCTPRFVALQRSGQYSELRIIQRGRLFRIVGYRWPDKGVRRKLKIGRQNPKQSGGPTPNQVSFGSRGRVVVGWINRETATRYEITYKVGAQTKTVWRHKGKVTFQATGKRGRVKKNPCAKTANPRTALSEAVKLSRAFHGFDPRKILHADIVWPKSLVVLGACVRLDYLCDKFDGKERIYFHEFQKACVVYAGPSPQKDGTNVLVIHGKFKIKPEGLTG